MVILIAFVHAIVVFALGCVWMKSRTGTILAAIVTSGVAFATGNPQFLFADLMGVGVGAWLSFFSLRTTEERQLHVTAHTEDTRLARKENAAASPTAQPYTSHHRHTPTLPKSEPSAYVKRVVTLPHKIVGLSQGGEVQVTLYMHEPIGVYQIAAISLPKNWRVSDENRVFAGLAKKAINEALSSIDSNNMARASVEARSAYGKWGRINVSIIFSNRSMSLNVDISQWPDLTAGPVARSIGDATESAFASLNAHAGAAIPL